MPPGEFVGATKTLDVTKKAKFVDIKGKRGVRTEVAHLDRSKAVFAFSLSLVDVPADGDWRVLQARMEDRRDHPGEQETAQACGIRSSR